MKNLIPLLAVCLGVYLFSVFGCGGGESQVSFLSLENKDTDSFKIGDAESEQTYILIPFSAASYSEGQNPTGTVDYSMSFNAVALSKMSSIGLTKKAMAKSAEMAVMEELPFRRAQMEYEQQRHAKTLDLKRRITQKTKGKPEGYFKSLYEKARNLKMRSDKVNYALSSELSARFYLTGDIYNVTGVLRGETANAAAYVDEDYNALVTDDTVNELLNTFENVSRKRVRSIWQGEETDIDSNGKVILFLSNLQDKTKVSCPPDGCPILGFYQPWDILASDVDSRSNEMEIVFSTYTNAGGETGYYKELIDATLAHEFFHMLNFIVKCINPALEGESCVVESLFLNEGMAHLTEDIVGHGYDAFNTLRYYLGYVSRASVGGSVDPAFQSSYDDEEYKNDTLHRRAAAMLFLRYLFEQKGGATYSEDDAADVEGGGVDFLRALNSSRYTGVNNLEKTYGSSFEEMFRSWVAALYLDGTDLSDDETYNYKPEEADSFTDQKRGFNLRGSRELPTGTTINLSGPDMVDSLNSGSGLTNFDGSVYASGCEFYELTVSGLSELTVTMSGTKGLGLGMTIVRVP